MAVSDRRRRASISAAAALAAAVLVVPRPALAQSASERALAESLFREGKLLLARGDVAEACRKLEESQRLDPAGGTLLNLATCHEKEGKLATAWAEYQGALELAKRARRRDRAALAARKVGELAPRVPHVVITIEGAPPEGLVVELDGVALGEASLGTELAVDPGDHAVTARAQGKIAWETTTAVAESETKTIAVPELAAVPPPPPPPAPPHAADPGGEWMRPTSYALGGAAIVALAVGTGFGVSAVAHGDTAADRCPGNVCDRRGLEAHETGRDAAAVANVALVLSALAGAGAVTLFVLAPGEAEPAASVALQAGPGSALGRVRVGF